MTVAISIGLIAAFLATGAFLATVQAADGSTGTVRPVPRIVNGSAASIGNSPWQVALLEPAPSGRRSKPTNRYFCSGSLLAPDVVVTAAHCVTGFTKSQRTRIEVVAGRTWLNQTGTGEVARVKRVLFALRPDGSRRFREASGSATWDVALIELDREMSAPVIRLAGSSETAVWSTGRRVKASGWGITSWRSGQVSNRLRIATQVILPDSVCRADNGRFYKTGTMVCLGGPKGHSSTCSGDSGGPLVARTSDGYRLVGLTSFGDFFCRGSIPSVDTRVSGDSIRSWVRQKTIELSGVDPVGTTGSPGPKPRSCRVPKLLRRTKSSARSALRRAGCKLGSVKRVDRKGYGRGRVVASSLPAGWLAPVGFGIRVRITR